MISEAPDIHLQTLQSVLHQARGLRGGLATEICPEHGKTLIQHRWRSIGAPALSQHIPVPSTGFFLMSLHCQLSMRITKPALQANTTQPPKEGPVRRIGRIANDFPQAHGAGTNGSVAISLRSVAGGKAASSANTGFISLIAICA